MARAWLRVANAVGVSRMTMRRQQRRGHAGQGLVLDEPAGSVRRGGLSAETVTSVKDAGQADVSRTR